MKIRHDIVKSNGKIIPYIYIELVDDYEFGKDFWTKDTEGSFTSKLKNYVKTFLNILQYALLVHEDIDYRCSVKYVSTISRNLYILEKITITNFKQFIHNLLMEMIE